MRMSIFQDSLSSSVKYEAPKWGIFSYRGKINWMIEYNADNMVNTVVLLLHIKAHLNAFNLVQYTYIVICPWATCTREMDKSFHK